jgi:hypothetical protein
LDLLQRLSKIENQIRQANPDILCLQEGRANYMGYIRRMLQNLRYEWTESFVNNSDGSFVLIEAYKPDEVKLIKAECYHFFVQEECLEDCAKNFPEMPLGEKSNQKSIIPAPGDKWGRIMTWARFRNKGTGKLFDVYNTHFCLDPISQVVCAGQLFLKMIQIKSYGDVPVVLVGDFNSFSDVNYLEILQHNAIVFQQELLRKLVQPQGRFVSLHDIIEVHGLRNLTGTGLLRSVHNEKQLAGTFLGFSPDRFKKDEGSEGNLCGVFVSTGLSVPDSSTLVYDIPEGLERDKMPSDHYMISFEIAI